MLKPVIYDITVVPGRFDVGRTYDVTLDGAPVRSGLPNRLVANIAAQRHHLKNGDRRRMATTRG